jgi:hypothetical protein
MPSKLYIVGIILIQKGRNSLFSEELSSFVKIVCLKNSGVSKKTSKIYPLKIAPKHRINKESAIIIGSS